MHCQVVPVTIVATTNGRSTLYNNLYHTLCFPFSLIAIMLKQKNIQLSLGQDTLAS